MSEAFADPPAFDPFEVTSTERLYDSSWCGLRRDQLRLPGGQRQEYHVFEIAPAVSIVPVLPDGSLILLWQLRHPHGRTHWELPAGRVDDGETPEQAAGRELQEETGYRPGRLERLCGFYPCNGISAHYAHLFVAHDCVHAGPPSLDPCERLSVHVMSALEAGERLRRGEFEDAFTALGLFHHFSRALEAREGP